MLKKIFIVGNSTKLGEALAYSALKEGYEVYTIGKCVNKKLLSRLNYYFLPIDIDDFSLLQEDIKEFISGHQFDLVILNEGIVGQIKEIEEFSLGEINHIMNTNVWSNKLIIDSLSIHNHPKQIVAISSEASLKPYKGLAPYAISKMALNTLIKAYANEKPWTHYSSISTGFFITEKLNKIIENIDPNEYPLIKDIKDRQLKSIEDTSKDLLDACKKALKYPSGSFLDMRTIV